MSPAPLSVHFLPIVQSLKKFRGRRDMSATLGILPRRRLSCILYLHRAGQRGICIALDSVAFSFGALGSRRVGHQACYRLTMAVAGAADCPCHDPRSPNVHRRARYRAEQRKNSENFRKSSRPVGNLTV